MNKGFLYEQKVLQTIANTAIICNSIAISCNTSAGFDNTKTDLNIKVGDQELNIEIKLNNKAQMGGTSIIYNDNQFKLVKSFNPELDQKIINTLKDKQDKIQEILDFWKTDKVPTFLSKDLYTKAVKQNLIKEINCNIETSIDTFCDFYQQKDCYYCQIGSRGLFYLKNNKYNIPIPKIDGSLNIEIRMTRNGSKFVEKYGCKMVTSQIRLQGRLKDQNTISPLSLDRIEDCKKIFEIVNG